MDFTGSPGNFACTYGGGCRFVGISGKGGIGHDQEGRPVLFHDCDYAHK